MSKVCCEVRTSLLGFLEKLGQSMFTEMKIETAIACPNSEDHQQCFRHKANHCKRDTCVPLIRKHGERYVECPDDNCDLEELPKNAKCWMSETAKFVTVRSKSDIFLDIYLKVFCIFDNKQNCVCVCVCLHVGVPVCVHVFVCMPACIRYIDMVCDLELLISCLSEFQCLI